MNDYESMPYAELKKLHTEIGETLKKRQEIDRHEAREKMQKMAEDMGFMSVIEMLGIEAGRNPKRKNGKRTPARIKYQNPDNPAETWTGKGRVPKWMQPLIEGGKVKEDFLVA